MSLFNDLGTALGRPFQFIGQSFRTLFTNPRRLNLGQIVTVATGGFAGPIVSDINHPRDLAYQAGAAAALIGGSYAGSAIAARTGAQVFSASAPSPLLPEAPTLFAPGFSGLGSPAGATAAGSSGGGVGIFGTIANSAGKLLTGGSSIVSGITGGAAKLLTAAAAAAAPLAVLWGQLKSKAQEIPGVGALFGGGQQIGPGNGGGLGTSGVNAPQPEGQAPYQAAGLSPIVLILLAGVAVFFLFGPGRKKK